MSAPVGQRQGGGGDDYQNAGRPQGQVAGAHMRYGPVSGDDRDDDGRGTVSRTDGKQFVYPKPFSSRPLGLANYKDSYFQWSRP